MKYKYNENTCKYKCPHCDKEYSKHGIGTHIWRKHGAGKEWVENNKGYKNGSRKGTNQFIKADKMGSEKPKVSEETKNKISIANKGNKHTEEFKLKQRHNAIKNGLGGVTQSRWINYNGKTLGSSYELKLVKDLDKHNIKWDTCKRFKYIDCNGKERTYTPDIYLIDYNIYLDPKNDFLIENINPNLGFKDTKKIKWCSEQNNIKVIILNKYQLSWDFIKKLL